MKIVCGIYGIKNKITGKYYVGSSTNILDRFLEHKGALRRKGHINNHLQSSYNLYGKEVFGYSILEEYNDLNTLLDREQWWMDYLNSNLNGYNLVNAKRGPIPNPKASKERRNRWEGLTEEKRKELSKQLLTPENLAGNSQRLLGLWQNETFRAERIDGLNRGRTKTNSSKNPKILEILAKGRQKAQERSKNDPKRKEQQRQIVKSIWENPITQQIMRNNLDKGREKLNARKKAEAAARRANKDIVSTSMKIEEIINKQGDI